MNLKLLKQKDFSLLILGKLVSLLGSNMQQFALSLYVLELTGSAAVFASILSIIIIPRLIFSPFAGVFGDWFDRKRSIVSLDMINAIVLGIYALIFITKGALSITLIYILVIILEIVEIFFHSAMSAVLPSIVKKDDLLEANSVKTLVMSIGDLLAPIIAALIYGAFGMKMILIVNSISFMLSSISEMFINVPKSHKRPEKISFKAFIQDLFGGVKLVKENKLLFTVITSGGVLNFCAAPLYSIGLVFIAKEILKISDFQFGLFQMILASSFIIAPIFGGKHIKKIRIGKLLYLSFVMIEATIVAMVFVPLNYFDNKLVPYFALMICAFLSGVFATYANIALGTLFSEIVPLELMGRISTIMGMAMTILIPIGQMIFGYLYDRIKPNYVIAIAGIILFIDILKHKKSLLEYGIDSTEEGKEIGVGTDEHKILSE